MSVTESAVTSTTFNGVYNEYNSGTVTDQTWSDCSPIRNNPFTQTQLMQVGRN